MVVRRLPVILVTMALVGAACGAGALGPEAGPRRSQTYGADTDRSIPACADGQVLRSVGPDVTGPSEADVVRAALDPWMADGAEPVAVPAERSWSAVIDGRVVAVAHPEQEGDGGWVVDQVVTCGKPETGSAPIDGALDCPGEASWVQSGSIDPEARGLPTAAEAVETVLDGYAERLDGTVALIDPAGGSVVVGDREVVTATAFRLGDDRGWVVDSISGCDGTGP